MQSGKSALLLSIHAFLKHESTGHVLRNESGNDQIEWTSAFVFISAIKTYYTDADAEISKWQVNNTWQRANTWQFLLPGGFLFWWQVNWHFPRMHWGYFLCVLHPQNTNGLCLESWCHWKATVLCNQLQTVVAKITTATACAYVHIKLAGHD